MEQVKTALVLGATGGIGGEMTRRLLARGWKVKALNRRGAQAGRAGDGICWLQGDALNRDDVVAAAQGVQLIVHAVNPPAYNNWAQLVLPMIDNSIAAARASGARIVLPGTVYNYGPDVLPLVHEDAPQNPVTRKGAIRAALEARLRAAAEDGVKSLVVRAGDFFGLQATNSWFAQGLVKQGRPVTSINYPGAAGLGHQWAYLPDVAETMIQLLEKEALLEPFAMFQMEGHWDADGTQMIESIRRVTGKPGLKVRRMPWGLMMLASPFVTFLKEVREMLYLWKQPVYMSNRRLLAVLGSEPHTPWDVAVRDTLVGLGCLSIASQAPASEQAAGTRPSLNAG